MHGSAQTEEGGKDEGLAVLKELCACLSGSGESIHTRGGNREGRPRGGALQRRKRRCARCSNEGKTTANKFPSEAERERREQP